MADFETSTSVNVAADVRPADPFTASNVTWVESISSTSNAWAGFYISHHDISALNGILLVATGATSSEVIIASMPVRQSHKGYKFAMYVPIPVASGTRISVAVASSAADTLQRIFVVGVNSSIFDAEPTWTVMESGPYDLEDDAATYGKWGVIDAGAVASTKGSYDDVVTTGTNSANNLIQGDSLGQTYDWLGILINDQLNISQSNGSCLIDVASGAVSSEVAFGTDLDNRKNSDEQNWNSIYWTPSGASSGTRISARASASTTDAVDRISGCLLFGVR